MCVVVYTDSATIENTILLGIRLEVQFTNEWYSNEGLLFPIMKSICSNQIFIAKARFTSVVLIKSNPLVLQMFY